MSKNKNRNNEQGVYALCITIGFIVGLGLGPAFDAILPSILTGSVLGAGTAYLINHQKKAGKKPHQRR